MEILIALVVLQAIAIIFLYFKLKFTTEEIIAVIKEEDGELWESLSDVMDLIEMIKPKQEAPKKKRGRPRKNATGRGV